MSQAKCYNSVPNENGIFMIMKGTLKEGRFSDKLGKARHAE
jgi:hypothetical protein